VEAGKEAGAERLEAGGGLAIVELFTQYAIRNTYYVFKQAPIFERISDLISCTGFSTLPPGGYLHFPCRRH
jgi:hypothetical protein